MVDIKFEIKARFGVISQSSKGWTKELNLISWNGREAKYDLREWSPDGQKMMKGITLTRQDMLRLREIVGLMELSEADTNHEDNINAQAMVEEGSQDGFKTGGLEAEESILLDE